MESLSPKEIESGWSNDGIGTLLVHSTDSVRIWHLRLPVGASMPPHRHDRPYFWTILTDGHAISRYDDGRVVNIEYTAGMTGDFPALTPSTGFVHDLINVGNTELVFVTVEFNR